MLCKKSSFKAYSNKEIFDFKYYFDYINILAAVPATQKSYSSVRSLL